MGLQQLSFTVTNPAGEPAAGAVVEAFVGSSNTPARLYTSDGRFIGTSTVANASGLVSFYVAEGTGYSIVARDANGFKLAMVANAVPNNPGAGMVPSVIQAAISEGGGGEGGGGGGSTLEVTTTDALQVLEIPAGTNLIEVTTSTIEVNNLALGAGVPGQRLLLVWADHSGVEGAEDNQLLLTTGGEGVTRILNPEGIDLAAVLKFLGVFSSVELEWMAALGAWRLLGWNNISNLGDGSNELTIKDQRVFVDDEQSSAFASGSRVRISANNTTESPLETLIIIDREATFDKESISLFVEGTNGDMVPTIRVQAIIPIFEDAVEKSHAMMLMNSQMRLEYDGLNGRWNVAFADPGVTLVDAE